MVPAHLLSFQKLPLVKTSLFPTGWMSIPMWTRILMLLKLILFGTSVLLQLVLLFSISPLCLVNYEIILKWKLVSTPTLLHSHRRDHASLHDLMWNGHCTYGVYTCKMLRERLLQALCYERNAAGLRTSFRFQKRKGF